jgi:hypothetical protein
MGKLKKFEDFWVKLTESELTRMDEAPGQQLAMDFPPDAPKAPAAETGFKAWFESPLYVTELWSSFWEEQMQYGTPKEFIEKAHELGNYDFDSYYDDWKKATEGGEEGGEEEEETTNGKDPDDVFWNAVWDEVKDADRPVRLIDSGVDDDDVEDGIVNDFNESDLAQYAKDMVPTMTDLKAISVKNGMFKGEATYSEAPTEEVLKATKKYLEGQYSDGWGEGYEQQEQEGGQDSPDYYVHAWAPHNASDRDSWFIKTMKTEKE